MTGPFRTFLSITPKVLESMCNLSSWQIVAPWNHDSSLLCLFSVYYYCTHGQWTCDEAFLQKKSQIIGWFGPNKLWGICGISRNIWPFRLDTIQDFSIKLGIKPRLHILKISIFSLNQVTVRLTKIMNNLFNFIKIQSHFLASKVNKIFLTFFLWRIFD